MIVVIDSTLLLLLINPRAKAPPADPSVVNAGNAEARLNHLLDSLEKNRTTIILPAPAYAELLIRSPQTVAEAFQSVESARAFRIAPFDKRAALECAIMLSAVWSKGSKRNKTATWAKVKFDHQVVAIVKTNAADVVYSDDSDVQAMCQREKLKVQGVWDLPPPPVDPQMDMFGKDSKPSDQ